ncbi:MAG: transposase [Microlunatus sp.]|nr:transposase [Microlunatus sp.]
MQTSAPGPIGATDQTQRLRRFRAGYYSASKHSAGKPIVAGWSYQWITQLGWANDSWTAPMDARRIAPTENTTQATATQIRDLLARLDEHEPEPMFVFDAGYDPIALTHELAEVPAAIVVRIRDDRVFYTDPTPPAPGTRGRRRRHGDRVKLTDPTTGRPRITSRPPPTRTSKSPEPSRTNTSWTSPSLSLSRPTRRAPKSESTTSTSAAPTTYSSATTAPNTSAAPDRTRALIHGRSVNGSPTGASRCRTGLGAPGHAYSGR